MSGDAKAETPAAVEADEDLLNIIQYSSSRVYGIRYTLHRNAVVSYGH